MDNQLKALQGAFDAELAQAASVEALELLRVKYLGRKGELTGILRQMGTLSADERPRIGALANQVKVAMEEGLTDRLSHLASAMVKAGELDSKVELSGEAKAEFKAAVGQLKII